MNSIIFITTISCFPFILSHIHHHHGHPPPFFHYPTFPFFPIEKCEFDKNYTNILNNYDRYFEGENRVFYLAHRNKNNEPQCYSKLKKMINSFNNNVFLTNKHFTFKCPKSNNQTEKILTLKLCLTEQEEEIISMPDDEQPVLDFPSNSSEPSFISEVVDATDIIKSRYFIPSNQITLCFRLYGNKIEKCLYDAFMSI